jgi:nitrite reductase/ring-hydroxylating ferredoxin subunit
MRRAKALGVVADVSRREFCAFACLGAASAAFLAACSDSGTAVGTGGLDGVDGNGNPVDASNIIHPDGGGSGSGSGSGSGGGTCTGAATDVGAPATFAMNVPKLISASNMFVVRDANGLYALTARCTHQGVQVGVSSGKFHCPAHGADFTFAGAVIDGPTSTPLQHYGLCLLSNGNVGLQTSTKVAATVRLSA